MFATQWPNSWAVIYLVKLVPKTFAMMRKVRFKHAQLTSIVFHGGLGARELGKEIKEITCDFPYFLCLLGCPGGSGSKNIVSFAVQKLFSYSTFRLLIFAFISTILGDRLKTILL